MPIKPDYQNKIKELADIIAVEATNKLSFLLNKSAKVNFVQAEDSCILEGKFIAKNDCILFTSSLEDVTLGSINILAANELVFCIADLIAGGQGKVTENVQPDETNQTVFESSAGTFMDSVIERLNSLKADLGLKVKEHKQKKLIKSKADTLEAPQDLTDPVALSFSVKMPNRLDLEIKIELSAVLVNHLIESLTSVLDNFDLPAFEEKIRKEYFGDSKPKDEDDVQASELSENGSVEGNEINQLRTLGVLKDINLDLIIELGRVQMTMKDVLKLTKGSAIELDRPANEPVDLYVHNQLVAKGEIVAVDDCFGLKVTQVLGKLNLNSILK